MIDRWTLRSLAVSALATSLAACSPQGNGQKSAADALVPYTKDADLPHIDPNSASEIIAEGYFNPRGTEKNPNPFIKGKFDADAGYNQRVEKMLTLVSGKLFVIVEPAIFLYDANNQQASYCIPSNSSSPSGKDICGISSADQVQIEASNGSGLTSGLNSETYISPTNVSWSKPLLPVTGSLSIDNAKKLQGSKDLYLAFIYSLGSPDPDHGYTTSGALLGDKYQFVSSYDHLQLHRIVAYVHDGAVLASKDLNQAQGATAPAGRSKHRSHRHSVS